MGKVRGRVCLPMCEIQGRVTTLEKTIILRRDGMNKRPQTYGVRRTCTLFLDLGRLTVPVFPDLMPSLVTARKAPGSGARRGPVSTLCMDKSPDTYYPYSLSP